MLAPQGRAVDIAKEECAGDEAYTVDTALLKLRNGRMTLDHRTIVVVDEAGLFGNNQLRELLTYSTPPAGAKNSARRRRSSAVPPGA